MGGRRPAIEKMFLSEIVKLDMIFRPATPSRELRHGAHSRLRFLNNTEC
jgi:hypothetical protein